MTLFLTGEQQRALAALSGTVLRLIDPKTDEAYVLLRAEVYERVKKMLDHKGDNLCDTYLAQVESAMRAGWDDPTMDDYNEYDAIRGKSFR